MRHGRISIKAGNDLFDFMWAGMANDGSVLMGLTQQGEGAIELVLDPHLGELKAEDLIAPKDVEAVKISFHTSDHLDPQVQLIARANQIGPTQIVQIR